ncbi:MAG: FG-GAP-like repeat-containing protein [Acidobacteria bacterium]|nr:FG-GAP-like repeat-containing protein [Acidobacteriota bacterium]
MTLSRILLVLLSGCLSAAVTIVAAAEPEPGAERVLRMILVRERAPAEKILASIKAGETFEVLAAQNSTDSTAAEGGYLGAVKLEDVRPELRQALEGVDEGQVTDVFQTPAGFMIVKVLRKAARTEPDPKAAAGSIQFAAYVSGFEESGYFFSRLPKPEDYSQDLAAICELKATAVESAITDSEAKLSQGTPSRELLQTHHTVGQLAAYQGSMDKTIQYFEAAYEIAVANDVTDFASALQEKLGVAHLRRGEVDNCIHDHNAQSCIFPLSQAARHRQQAGSERAMVLFLEYLRANPADLEVRWLASIAAMTLGKYPEGIPSALRFPPRTFESQADVGRFVDIAAEAGLGQMNTAGGSIIDDFDNDGLLDIVISIVNVCEPMRYYHNSGDGSFSDWTERAKLGGQLGGINLNQADYNNDGRLDIFVMRGGWELPMRNSLLRNNADGTFTDVTKESGLAAPAYPTPTASWADFDNDGFVDLFVGNENAPGQLFRNNGDGTFTDVAKKAGMDRKAFTKSAVWGDYNDDSFPDLYVSNFEAENFLYHNNGDGSFTEVARALRVERPNVSFPVWFFDYDNDGRQDLFVSSYVQSVAEIAAEYLSLPTQGETIKLYRNMGPGGFEDVTKQVGLERISMAMGANFGDIDNDGFLDIYLGTGSPSYSSLVPNLMFRNQEGATFADITSSSGTGHLQKGHGIAFGDLNNDGDEDIFLHVGGAIPGDTYRNVLFKNPGHENNWIGLKLVGTKSNRAAIGAKIKVNVASADTEPRSIYRVVTSGGSFGASSFEQHIGLGKAERVATLEIRWPASGSRQVFKDVGVNQTIEIKESEDTYRTLERLSFTFPDAAEGASHH